MTTFPKLVRLEQEARDTQASAASAKAGADLLAADFYRAEATHKRLAGQMPDAERKARAAEIKAAESELTAAKGALDRARKEHAARQQTSDNASQVLAQCSQWVKAQKHGTVFEPLELKMPKPAKGETVQDALGHCRRLIAAAKANRQAIENAPPSADEITELVHRHVESLAREARPGVGLVNGEFSINWIHRMSAPAHLCWLFPKQVAAALLKQLGDADGIPAHERRERLGAIKSELWALECREECLIEACHAAGHAVQRRADASPSAILQVKVSKAAAQAAA